MSRSRKKYPVTGFSCKESDKMDKVFAHRRFRKRCKQLMKLQKELLYKLQEVSEVACFQKDGKHNWRFRPYIVKSLPSASEEWIDKQYRK